MRPITVFIRLSYLFPSWQTQEREEDQRTLNLIGESLHLLGNTLLALSDLRCNLSAQPPRNLHVVRPMSHYTSPLVSYLPPQLFDFFYS